MTGLITKMHWQYFIERFCAENLVVFEQDEGAFFRYAGRPPGPGIKVVRTLSRK